MNNSKRQINVPYLNRSILITTSMQNPIFRTKSINVTRWNPIFQGKSWSNNMMQGSLSHVGVWPNKCLSQMHLRYVTRYRQLPKKLKISSPLPTIIVVFRFFWALKIQTKWCQKHSNKCSTWKDVKYIQFHDNKTMHETTFSNERYV